MFNLGFSEMILVGVIALVFIGPKQLPEIARVLGRMINEFKKATSDLSGGLLDIKNELREPFEEGLHAVEKIRSDIVSRTEDFVNSATNMDQLDLPVQEQSPKHGHDQVHDDGNDHGHEHHETAEIETDHDPKKV